MGNYALNHLTTEELEAYRSQYPRATEPAGPWELKDDEMRLGFYKTEEEAITVRDELQRDDDISESFECWADGIATSFNILPSEVEKIVRDHLS